MTLHPQANAAVFAARLTDRVLADRYAKAQGVPTRLLELARRLEQARIIAEYQRGMMNQSWCDREAMMQQARGMTPSAYAQYLSGLGQSPLVGALWGSSCTRPR